MQTITSQSFDAVSFILSLPASVAEQVASMVARTSEPHRWLSRTVPTRNTAQWVSNVIGSDSLYKRFKDGHVFRQKLQELDENGALFALSQAIRHARIDLLDSWVDRSGRIVVSGHIIDVNVGNGIFLEQAIQDGQLSSVKFLIEHGANPRLKDSFCLIVSVMESQTDIFNYLLNLPEDIRPDVTADREAPIGYAAMYGFIDIIRSRIAYDVPISREHVQDAFNLACGYGRLNVVEYLLSLPLVIRPDVHENSEQALMFAAGGRSREKFPPWIDAGLTIEEDDARHLQVVKFLIERHGAEPFARNGEALTRARRAHYIETEEYLYDTMAALIPI